MGTPLPTTASTALSLPHSLNTTFIMRFSNSVSTFQLATAATLFSALAIKTVAASPLLTVRQEDNGDDNDDDDDDDDDSNDGPTAVDVILVQVITLAKGLMLERDANGSYVNAQLALPANLPAGNWAIGVDELDDDDDSMNSAVNAAARNTTSPDALDDFDYTFRTSQDRTERASYVYLTVGDDGTQNTTGTTAGAATTSAAAATQPRPSPLAEM